MSGPVIDAEIIDDEREAPVLWRQVGDLSPEDVATTKAYVEQTAGPLTVAQAPNAFVSDYETMQAFALAGALAPPEDPRQVANIYRRSSALRPCVESVATNSVGFGHTFEPVIDLAHADADKRVREALMQDTGEEPTDAQVAECRAMIERESLKEQWRLDRFFDYCCPSRSFGKLRWEARVEVESGGNAYWEVTRRSDGGLATFDRIEAHTMRLRRTEQRYLNVEFNQRRSPLSYERVRVPMRFRTFVQIVLGGAKAVYFKQYGDPRTLSSQTGRWYLSQEMLRDAEPGVPPATEVIHWRAFDTIGPYGVPRWYGAQYAVMGSLASERINYDYFDNKAIPPFVVMVSGGRLAEGYDVKLKELLAGIKGQANFWKILVLQAESTAGSNAKCRIELHPLLKRSEEDAMFQEYEAQNEKKIQRQWRLPDLLVGKSQEANRAQAEAALQMAEQQVFQPFREEEDDFFNRFILPEMGIRFWRFKTNSAVARDPQLQTEIATTWMKAGALTPNEGRRVAADVLNDPTIQPIEEPWANIPQPLILAGIMPGVGADGRAVTPPANAGTLAQQLIATRDSLRAQADTGAAVEGVQGRAGKAMQVVEIDDETWRGLWQQ